MPTIHYPDSNRVGSFNVTYAQLSNDAERPMLEALFALCEAMLKVEEHESGRGRTFYAASNSLFCPLVEDEEIPEYRIEFAAPGATFANPEDEARAVTAQGGFRFVAIRKTILRVPAIALAVQSKMVH